MISASSAWLLRQDAVTGDKVAVLKPSCSCRHEVWGRDQGGFAEMIGADHCSRHQDRGANRSRYGSINADEAAMNAAITIDGEDADASKGAAGFHAGCSAIRPAFFNASVSEVLSSE